MCLSCGNCSAEHSRTIDEAVDAVIDSGFRHSKKPAGDSSYGL